MNSGTGVFVGLKLVGKKGFDVTVELLADGNVLVGEVGLRSSDWHPSNSSIHRVMIKAVWQKVLSTKYSYKLCPKI
jgi:hypothetical protein